MIVEPIDLATMLATATMARLQRINCLVTAPNITVVKFTMTAMIGRPPRQINMPRPDDDSVAPLLRTENELK